MNDLDDFCLLHPSSVIALLTLVHEVPITVFAIGSMAMFKAPIAHDIVGPATIRAHLLSRTIATLSHIWLSLVRGRADFRPTSPSAATFWTVFVGAPVCGLSCAVERCFADFCREYRTGVGDRIFTPRCDVWVVRGNTGHVVWQMIRWQGVGVDA